MAVRTPLVLTGNKAGALNPEDTLGGRAAVQPMTQTDYDNLPSADVDVLYIRMADPPSGFRLADMWFGTLTEYNVIDPKDPNTLYVVHGA